jgi:4'-phosphopantetheinyl transferase
VRGRCSKRCEARERSRERTLERIAVFYADRRTLSEELVDSLVTDEDRVRVTPTMVPRRRFEYLAARALLRHVLERYTGRSGASFSVRVAADGKPGCVDGPAISLSHSGDLVVCAIGECPALGVDVEARAPRTVSVTEIAERYFTSAEARWIAAAPAARFGMLWVLKEAYLKALGSGLPGGLDTLECRIEPPAIFARLTTGTEVPRLTLWEGRGCHVGLAVLGAPARAVTLERWAAGGEQDELGPLALVAATP